jgi:thiopurine S-methyltransferase
VTLDYDQAQMNGPPFAVSEAELRQLFSEEHRLQHLETLDCLEDEPRFREKGLTRLDESAWLLTRRA